MSQVLGALHTQKVPALRPQLNYESGYSELRNRSGRVVRAGAMGMHGPPFTWRRALPLVKRAKKRVRIFVAEKIRGFIQFERGMQ